MEPDMAMELDMLQLPLRLLLPLLPMLLDTDMLVPFTSLPWSPTLMELSPLLMSLLLLLPVLTIWPPSTELLKLLMELDTAMELDMLQLPLWLLLPLLPMLLDTDMLDPFISLLWFPMLTVLSPLLMSLLLWLPVLTTWLPMVLLEESMPLPPTTMLLDMLLTLALLLIHGDNSTI